MINSLRNIDYSLFHFINHTLSNPFFDFLFPVIRNPHTWIPLYIILAFYCLWKFKKTAWIYILVVVIAFALSDHITSAYFKSFFCRLRPCHQNLMHARLLLESCGGKYGLPSTHASNHMTIAFTIILTGFFISKWIKTLLILWALLIGFAQIYVGVHYPSDILGGYIFGIIVSLFVYYMIFPLLKKLHNKFVVTT